MENFLKLKGKFYRTVVRLAMLYGTEYWTVKNQNENKISIAEIRILSWMFGRIRHDRIRNDNIRESWSSAYCRKDYGNSA
jgi:hypothetical protein